MALSDKIKRDFAKHKGKAGILAVLAVVMLGFIVKAVFDMNPRSAAAEAPTTPGPTVELPASTPDSEARLRQSKELWKTLREVRGAVTPEVAFTFDNSTDVFPPNPNRKIAPSPEKVEPINLTPKVSTTDLQATAQEQRNRILAASRELIVRSTVMGTGKPVAIVNDRILGIGDRINGFEVTAIRANAKGSSEVEFKKDKVTIVIEMVRNPNQK